MVIFRIYKHYLPITNNNLQQPQYHNAPRAADVRMHLLTMDSYVLMASFVRIIGYVPVGVIGS